MTASESTRGRGKDASDVQNDSVTVEWQADYSLDSVEEWDPLLGGIYEIGRVSPAEIDGSARAPLTAMDFFDHEFADRNLHVNYTPECVCLNTNAHGDEGETDFEAVAKLSPEAAAELGQMLQRAGEELAARREAETDAS